MKLKKAPTNYILLLVAGFLFSLLSVFSLLATNFGIDAFNQMVWRTLFAFVIAGIGTFIFLKQDLLITKKQFKYIFVNGLLFVGAISTFTLGIYLGTPIAKAVALNLAYPLVVIVASFIFLKEKPTFKGWIATLVSLISVALILELWKIKNLFSLNLGDLFELFNSFFYGLIIVWGKKMSRDTKLNPLKSIFYSYIITTLVLFLLGKFVSIGLNNPTIGNTLHILNTVQYLILFGLGLCMVFPLALIYRVSLSTKAYVIAIFLLTEPVWAYVLGLLIFNQSLNMYGLLGIIGIIISILIL